jgi:amino acid adenylation domain-containing protein
MAGFMRTTSEHQYVTEAAAMTPSDLLESKAEDIANEVAVVSGEHRLTYYALNAQANRLARYLIRQGAGPETVIAVALPRDESVMVALFAVLKARAVYLPIDLDNPAERIRLVLEDAHPAAIVTTEAVLQCLPDVPDIPVHVLSDRRLVQELASYPEADLVDKDRVGMPRPENTAYVMYTSGSTGRPKGVMVPYSAIANIANVYSRESEVFYAAFSSARQKRLRVAHTASWAFDSAWPPVLWMIDGHEMHIISELDRRNPQALAAYLKANSIDCLNSTPEYIRQVMELGFLGEGASAPSFIIVGGDAISRSLWSELRSLKGPNVYNAYGPTECTVDAIGCELSVSPEPRLGQAVTNVDAYVLGEDLRQVPTGETGELYITGAGVARGYLGLPGRTAERFVASPFGSSGERMYRTGDLARRHSDGTFEFIGRADGQVKVRGYRVELGDIEFALTRHPSVGQALATVYADSAGNLRLVAYLVPAPGQLLTDTSLRGYAESALPRYMIPSAFIIMDGFPLTPNGKIDRNALPAPSGPAVSGHAQPVTHDVQVMCQLFAEVLGLSAVAADEDFFSLGGHSMLVAQLVDRVRSELNVEMSFRSLFEAPTAATLAKLLRTDHISDPLEGLLPLRQSGNRPPLFCIHPGGGLSWCYSALLSQITGDCPIYGIQARGLHPDEKLPQSIEQMADDYLNLITSVQGHGPYRLAGWCFGGTVAHEIAVRLREIGESVEVLVLVDSIPANPRVADSREALRDVLDERLLVRDVLNGLDVDSGKLNDEPADELTFSEIARKAGSSLRVLKDDVLANLLDIGRNNLWLSMNFTPKVFDGDMLYFKSQEFDNVRSWERHVSGSIITREVPFDHGSVTHSEAVSMIGKEISASLL